MSFSLADLYYLKALGSYEYSPDESFEYLGYALSAEPEHAGANQLIGKLYLEVLNNLSLAEDYLNASLVSNSEQPETAFLMVEVFRRTNRFEDALRLLAFTENLVGVNKSDLYKKRSAIYEHQRRFEMAIEQLRLAMIESFTIYDVEFLKLEIKRVAQKQKVYRKLLEHETESVD